VKSSIPGAGAYTALLRKRWLSPRALLLHLAVVVIAPGCGVAGWWQATRALAGNGLSWAYSVEWPIFGLIAVAGWWQLVHEDPEDYAARKRGAPEVEVADDRHRAATASSSGAVEQPQRATEEPATLRLAAVLAGLVCCELVLGVTVLVSVPVGRPAGLLPAGAEGVFLVHAVFGFLLAVASAAAGLRLRRAPRPLQVAAWVGFSGVALAGVGGLLTAAPALARFLGMALMFVGPLLAVFGYLAPAFLGSSESAARASEAAELR
jgi:hypothetical protein